MDAVRILLLVHPGVVTYVFVHPIDTSLFACPGEATGSNMPWTQGPCQDKHDKHSGRFVTASLTWTVGNIKTRRSQMQLSSMFVRHPRLTAPNGTKRKG